MARTAPKRPAKPSTPPRSAAPLSRTYQAVVREDDGTTMTALDVPFDPKAVFGKVRAPVRVTVNGGHTFRSTICAMGGAVFVPLRRSNREAAGVSAGQTVKVTLALDTEPRVVEVPRALMAALRAGGPGVVAAWKKLAYTHQREHVEAVAGAKKPETKARRIEACVEAMRDRAGTARTAGTAGTPGAGRRTARKALSNRT